MTNDERRSLLNALQMWRQTLLRRRVVSFGSQYAEMYERHLAVAFTCQTSVVMFLGF